VYAHMRWNFVDGRAANVFARAVTDNSVECYNRNDNIPNLAEVNGLQTTVSEHPQGFREQNCVSSDMKKRFNGIYDLFFFLEGVGSDGGLAYNPINTK